ncbi:NfeD family protein [Propionibacteriaceae bacterium Y1923]|uniref:hypothetical protein n=1 Tax=Aestuariimicrobium sp. Y1814 TaxID=3418742 RepID=UPI003C1BF2CB
MEFLIIGGIGLVVLVLALVLGDFLDLSVPFEGMLDNDVFSVATISAFVGAFGFGGAIAQEIFSTLWIAVPVAVVMGLLFSWFTIWLTRKLKNSATGTSVNTRSLVGREATVLTAIPEDGYGEIRLSVNGHRTKYSAKAKVAVEAGSSVWISDVLSATAVEVTPTHELPPGVPEPGPDQNLP